MDYVEEVIKKGNLGSSALRTSTAPSLLSNEYVKIVEYGSKSIVGLRVPRDKIVVVHSASGNYELTNPREHAMSMVDSLVCQANRLGVMPIGLANVIDSNIGDVNLIRAIGEAMNSVACENGIAIMNGENAVLGDLIDPTYGVNVFGTAVSIVDRNQFGLGRGGSNGIDYYAFDPKEQFIFMNSDGVGTKTDIYRRTDDPAIALIDSAAMKVDDSAKIGAEVVLLWDNIEAEFSEIDGRSFFDKAEKIGLENGFVYTLSREFADGRVRGYNVSGNAVSLVSEERLRNPLISRNGDYLVAIKAKGPRSNGITAKRKVMEKFYGVDWHKNPSAAEHLKFLSQPSIIFYSAFKDLIDQELASAVYHMSGGAFDDKLAKPLSEAGLLVHIEDLFEPHSIERELAEKSFDSVKASYKKWPMGNEGFVSTSRPDETMKILANHGLESKVVGCLEAADDTGVELIAYNGDEVYFSGDE